MESTLSVRSKKKSRPKFGRRKKRSCLRVKKKTESRSEELLVKEEEDEKDSQDFDDLLDGQSESGVGDAGGFSGLDDENKPSTQEEQLSMPASVVTSRSKRFRGATATSVAYTDRKTRSTSTTFNPHPLSVQVESSTSVIEDGVEESDLAPETKTQDFSSINGESEKSKSSCNQTSNNFAHDCANEENHQVTKWNGPRSRPNESMKIKTGQKAEEQETEEKSKDEECQKIPNVETKEGTISRKVEDGKKVANSFISSNIQSTENDWRRNIGRSGGGCGDESKNVQLYGSASNSELNHVTITPQVSVSGGSAKKSKLIEERKQTLAPMLLMSNLPYMGELTFDTRPRRGRKPKKVDICHLISKNYGIHFPNSYTNIPYTGPPAMVKPQALEFKVKSGKKKISLSNVSTCPPQPTWTTIPSPPALLPIKTRLSCPTSLKSKTQIQFNRLNPQSPLSSPSLKSSKVNKVPSTQDQYKESGNSGFVQKSNKESVHEEQPLNLCVRDACSTQNRFIKLRTQNVSSCNYSEIRNLKLPLLSSNLFSDFQLNPYVTSSTGNKIVQNIQAKTKGSLEGSKKIGKISQENTATSDLHLVNNFNFELAKQPESSSLLNSQDKFRFVPPISHYTSKSESRKMRKRKLHSRSISKPEVVVAGGHVGYELHNTAGGTLFGGHADSGPNSNAQVSICKFKFTGGAKPSLQEKKMLSVDSGGNFRFYTDKDKVGGSSSSNNKSGKSQGNLASSSVGGDSHQDRDQDCQYAYSALPKSAKSMSVCMPVRPSSLKTVSSSSPASSTIASTSTLPSSTSTGTAQDLSTLQQLETCSPLGMQFQFPGGEDGYSSSQSSESGGQPSGSNSSMLLSELASGQYNNYDEREMCKSRQLRLKRKRRTRKSLMREKLEKTFKEKGFLIQTQQLESAEGATYCKFRQLRKFTRYLFRSWKDYLPDNVREINSAGGSSQNVDGTSEWRDPSSLLAISGGKGGCSTADMDLSTATTNSQVPPEDSDMDEEDDDDDDEDEETRLKLVPEVTLITEPSSPVEVEQEMNTNSEGSDDVDVEHIDDGVDSDNISPRHNSPHHNKEDEEEGRRSQALLVKNSSDDSTKDKIHNDN